MQRLIVNGEQHEFPATVFPQTVAALIEAMNLGARSVVAEVNGSIVPQDEFHRAPIRPGDTVELVQFVGGG